MRAILLTVLLVAATAYAGNSLVSGAPGSNFVESNGIQAVITVQPTCDSSALGLEIVYRKGAGATEITSRCVCEQIAGPSYVWNSATSSGDCT